MGYVFGWSPHDGMGVYYIPNHEALISFTENIVIRRCPKYAINERSYGKGWDHIEKWQKHVHVEPCHDLTPVYRFYKWKLAWGWENF
jgi:hypothetical protein